MPLEVAQKAVTVMALAERCAALGNLNAISDAASAAALAQAALTSAGYNVRININGLSDKTAGDGPLSQLHTLETRARKLEKEVHNTLTERAGIHIRRGGPMCRPIPVCSPLPCRRPIPVHIDPLNSQFFQRSPAWVSHLTP